MRLIDADSLIEEINKVYAVEEKEDLKWAKGLHYAKAIIRDMPTIETDASTILKEQEAVEPIVAFTRANGTKAFSCPRCSALIRGGNYCSHCGQALKDKFE